MVNAKIKSKEPINHLEDLDIMDLFDIADPKNRMILSHAGIQDPDAPEQT